jgi:hypothetical protein
MARTHQKPSTHTTLHQATLALLSWAVLVRMVLLLAGHIWLSYLAWARSLETKDVRHVVYSNKTVGMLKNMAIGTYIDTVILSVEDNLIP